MSNIFENKGAMAATIVVAASNSLNQAAANYVCDGVADNVEIQAAIDVLDAIGGGTVVLLEGQYNIAALIEPKRRIEIRGQGKGTLLYLVNGADCTMFRAAAGAAVDRLYAAFRDMRLDGNKLNQGAVTSHGIHLSGFRNCLFENLRIENFKTDGIRLDDDAAEGWQHEMRWVQCYSNDGNGAYIRNENTKCRNCYFNANGTDGVQLRDAMCSFVDCNLELNGGEGVNVIATNRAWISQCHFKDNADGVQLYGATDCWVTFNDFESDTANGVVLQSTPTIITQRNRITGNYFNGEGTGVRDGDAGAGAPAHNVIKNNYSTGSTIEEYWITLGTTNTYDIQAMSVELDLTGAPADVEVFHAHCKCYLVSYKVLYSVATGGGAGVNIRVGRYQDGVALDDDYFDVTVSEINKSKGYEMHIDTSALTQRVIATGDTVTVGTAGGKADTGSIILILQIAEMAD